MKDIIVRNLKLNTEEPKICNAVIGETREAIIQETKILSELEVDLFEWRADNYKDISSKKETLETMLHLQRAAKNKPVIFSIRSIKSGGSYPFSVEARARACQWAIESGSIDLVELELSFGKRIIDSLIAAARERNVKTIVSFYDYEKTPEQKQLIAALDECESYGADLSKLAVMAKTKRDILNLLVSMWKMENSSDEKPRIVVGMGPQGNISRILPSFFGSVLTYASGITMSLEGQINPNDLRTILSLTK